MGRPPFSCTRNERNGTMGKKYKKLCKVAAKAANAELEGKHERASVLAWRVHKLAEALARM